MSAPVLAGPRRRLVKIVDQVMDSMQDVPSSIRWADELGGGMRPCEPVSGVALTVKSGQLPMDLAGCYMRTGPNLQFFPPKKRTHVFDGDGMVHSVRFAGGSATYNCDYMQTPRHNLEKELGHEWFTRIGEMHGMVGLAKILAVGSSKAQLHGLKEWETGTANTAIGCTPEGKVWGCMEGGPPFQFRLGETGAVSSVGFDTLSGTHKAPLSAHPKFDQRTGETFFHGRELATKKFYVCRAIDGKVVERADLKMAAGFHHDMFITENYVCIVDGSMRFTPEGVVKKKPLWVMDKKVKLRFGVFPRKSGKMTADAFIWIDSPVTAEVVHTLHAYDEGGKIVLWTPCQFFVKGNNEGILGDGGPFHMHRFVIDVEQKAVDLQMVPGGEDIQTEFPRIRDDRLGLSLRYGFSAIQNPGESEFDFSGILKWDMESCQLVGRISFPEGVVGGEAVFLSREGSSPDEAGDDGYIGLFLWNVPTRESTFAIYDARSFSSQPIAELLVPRRVPLGFHAAWISEEQFQKQLAAP